MFPAAQAHILVNVVMAGLFMLLKQSQPHLLRPYLSGVNGHLPTMSGSDMFSSSGATRVVAFSAIGCAGLSDYLAPTTTDKVAHLGAVR